MAFNKRPDNLGTHEDAWRSEFEELETMESDMNQMAQKILEYRKSLPDQLKSTLASVLAVQRPIVPEISDPGPSEAPNPDAAEQDDISGGEKLLSLEDSETGKETQLLKEKISRNVSTMPLILRQMRECIARIEKLDSYNVSIHPSFQRKNTR